MHTRILHPGDEAALEAFLLPRLASSMFLLSNARTAGLAYTGERLSGVYAAAFEGDEMVGVVGHFWNGVLILSAPTGARELCQVVLEASGRPVAGVIGPNDQAEVALAAVGIGSGQARMDEREKLYRLYLAELATPEALLAGAVVGRRAEHRDVDTLAGWRVGYEVEALAGEDTPEALARCRAAVQRGIAEGGLWVLEDGGAPVSMTGFNARMREAVQVGGVWTPPVLRRRGYARCVVAASLLDARDEGVELGVLFTGQQNVAAQRAYEALGFAYTGDYRLMLL